MAHQPWTLASDMLPHTSDYIDGIGQPAMLGEVRSNTTAVMLQSSKHVAQHSIDGDGNGGGQT